MESDLLLARRAALTGAAVALRFFAARARLVREVKADSGLVTAADRAVEVTIKEVLTTARPDDAFLGEETGQTGQAGRRWLVDPIDGTTLFVAGDDRWLVLVALEEAGEIVAGVAAVPAQGRIWWAERGGGAYEAEVSGAEVRDERVLQVASRGSDAVAQARWGVIPSAENLFPDDYRLVAGLSALTAPLPWRTHAALLVARGELDLAVQTRGEVWDFAATSLIVREAGGRYSGLDGRPEPRAGVAVFSGSQRLHGQALALLNQAPETGSA